jgi:hypothetical protein
MCCVNRAYTRLGILLPYASRLKAEFIFHLARAMKNILKKSCRREYDFHTITNAFLIISVHVLIMQILLPIVGNIGAVGLMEMKAFKFVFFVDPPASENLKSLFAITL